MAAGITETNGKAEMAYTGQKPWHNLGTYVPHQMTAAEALEEAGLGWEVHKVPVYLQGGVEIPEWYATIRGDTKAVLGVVGERYEPLQNADAFRFMDELVGESLAMYDTVGSLWGGKKVWLLAKLPESVAVANRDPIERYLLLANGHDGTQGLNVMWTPVRVVCNNTLTVALRDERGRRFRTSHTVNIKSRLEEAQQILGLAREYFQEFIQEAERLMNTPMALPKAANILGRLFEIDKTRAGQLVKDGGAKAPSEKAALEVLRLSKEGLGNQEYAGTAWGLYNGVTEWLDYHRAVRRADADERRLEKSWWGQSATMRQQAWDLLTVAGNN